MSYHEVPEKNPDEEETCETDNQKTKSGKINGFWKKVGIGFIVFCIVTSIVIPMIVKFSKNENEHLTNNSAEPSYQHDQTGLFPKVCIFNTSKHAKDYWKTLKTDPFGKLCDVDSAPCKSDISSHFCQKCKDEKMIPLICHCDDKIHCPVDGSKALDYPGKQSCSKCLEAFISSIYKNRGTCYCINGSPKCDCKEGYDNFMCSSISLRVCTNTFSSNVVSGNSGCKTNRNKCSATLRDNTTLQCDIFSDANIKSRKTAMECELDDNT